MNRFSFYAIIAGQIIFVLLIEALFFYDALLANLIQHIILAVTLFSVTALTFYVSRKMADPHYFIQAVIASTTVKLIIYIAAIFIIVYFMGSAHVSYLFYFFVTYLLVTSTEIIYLIKAIRPNQNKTV